MFDNFSFLMPILIIGILNIVILSLPSVLLWVESVLDDNGKSCKWLSKSRINFYGLLTTLVCMVIEVLLLIFVFVTNGITNTLYCALYQGILFVAICVIPQVLYQLYGLIKEVGKFIQNFFMSTLNGVVGVSTLILIIPISLYALVKFFITKIFKKI